MLDTPRPLYEVSDLDPQPSAQPSPAARFAAERKSTAITALPEAGVVEQSAVAPRHPIKGAAPPGTTGSQPQLLTTMPTPSSTTPAPAPPESSTNGAVPLQPQPPPQPRARPQRLRVGASLGSGDQGGDNTPRAGCGVWQAAPRMTTDGAALQPRPRPRPQPIKTALTPRECSTGLQAPMPPRVPHFANLAEGATPRAHRDRRYGTWRELISNAPPTPFRKAETSADSVALCCHYLPPPYNIRASLRRSSSCAACSGCPATCVATGVHASATVCNKTNDMS